MLSKGFQPQAWYFFKKMFLLQETSKTHVISCAEVSYNFTGEYRYSHSRVSAIMDKFVIALESSRNFTSAVFFNVRLRSIIFSLKTREAVEFQHSTAKSTRFAGDIHAQSLYLRVSKQPV